MIGLSLMLQSKSLHCSNPRNQAEGWELDNTKPAWRLLRNEVGMSLLGCLKDHTGVFYFVAQCFRPHPVCLIQKRSRLHEQGEKALSYNTLIPCWQDSDPA